MPITELGKPRPPTPSQGSKRDRHVSKGGRGSKEQTSGAVAGAGTESEDEASDSTDSSTSDDAPLDTGSLPVIFGLTSQSPQTARGLRNRNSTGSLTASGAQTARGTGGNSNSIFLLPQKRSANIEISLSRLKLSNKQITDRILDPYAGGQVENQLTAEQVSVLLSLLPTADEIELVRSNADMAARFGRVELFFLQISRIEQSERRLGAIQACHLRWVWDATRRGETGAGLR